jgi:hypothetical protein
MGDGTLSYHHLSGPSRPRASDSPNAVPYTLFTPQAGCYGKQSEEGCE